MRLCTRSTGTRLAREQSARFQARKYWLRSRPEDRPSANQHPFVGSCDGRSVVLWQSAGGLLKTIGRASLLSLWREWTSLCHPERTRVFLKNLEKHCVRDLPVFTFRP